MFALAAIFAVFLISSVSAYSIWEPKYESYRLGSTSNGNGAYSSTSTYEKTVVENEDRYGSDSKTTIRKTESESFVPSRTNSRYRYYDNDYNDRYYDNDYRYNDYRYDDGRYDRPRYIYTDSYGRTQFHDFDRDDFVVRDYDTYVRYDDNSWYPSTNWRFKETYRTSDYPHENDYGYDYYYKPRYDWHQQIFNWRY